MQAHKRAWGAWGQRRKSHAGTQRYTRPPRPKHRGCRLRGAASEQGNTKTPRAPTPHPPPTPPHKHPTNTPPPSTSPPPPTHSTTPHTPPPSTSPPPPHTPTHHHHHPQPMQPHATCSGLHVPGQQRGHLRHQCRQARVVHHHGTPRHEGGHEPGPQALQLRLVHVQPTGDAEAQLSPQAGELPRAGRSPRQGRIPWVRGHAHDKCEHGAGGGGGTGGRQGGQGGQGGQGQQRQAVPRALAVGWAGVGRGARKGGLVEAGQHDPEGPLVRRFHHHPVGGLGQCVCHRASHRASHRAQWERGRHG
jgi:hypothetical protein